jgi:Tfp pilus assembly protein PilN
MKIDSPVRMLNAMDAALKSSSSRGNIPYAAVGGALEFLLPKTRGLNLLSRGLRTREKTPVALTVLLALGISVAVLLYLTAPLRVERNRLSRIESEIPAKKAEARKVEALRAEADALSAEIAAISDFKESKPTALSLVKELTTVLPNSAWLSRLRINGPTVEIEGFATASTELLPKLEASKHFRKVEFASPTFRDNRMNADRFSIRMEIEDIPEAKPEAATAKKTEKEKGRHEKK